MPADPSERSWRAMGSDAKVIVVGGSGPLVDRAVERIEQLEDRWSRFRPHSEIRALNAHAGSTVRVSADTLELASLARRAWEATGGRYDPTVGGAVIAAGYDESFDRFDGRTRPIDRRGMVAGPGLGAMVIDDERSAVGLPLGAVFDPGALGKGLAADLVVSELLAAGADGALVSLGGDVRVAGDPGPGAAGAWRVGIADPTAPDVDLAVAALADGAVTTSSTLRRRWASDDGAVVHHIIDPATGEPSTSTVVAATVIAADGATAEVLSTACVVAGAEDVAPLVERMGAGALLIDADGHRHVIGSFEAFLVMPFPLAGAGS